MTSNFEPLRFLLYGHIHEQCKYWQSWFLKFCHCPSSHHQRLYCRDASLVSQIVPSQQADHLVCLHTRKEIQIIRSHILQRWHFTQKTNSCGKSSSVFCSSQPYGDFFSLSAESRAIETGLIHPAVPADTFKALYGSFATYQPQACCMLKNI